MKLQRLAQYLLPRLSAIKRPPNFLIGGEADPYMRRWYLIPRNKFFNVYLHNMLRSDDDVLHDHPWWSLSLVLSNGLRENYCTDPSAPGGTTRTAHRVVEQGSVVLRSPRMAHALVVDRPVWTLFLTGPVVRNWGFWCPKGWRPWQKYVEMRGRVNVSYRASGLGCGEDQ
jgi:hypothetical protein